MQAFHHALFLQGRGTVLIYVGVNQTIHSSCSSTHLIVMNTRQDSREPVFNMTAHFLFVFKAERTLSEWCASMRELQTISYQDAYVSFLRSCGQGFKSGLSSES